MKAGSQPSQSVISAATYGRRCGGKVPALSPACLPLCFSLPVCVYVLLPIISAIAARLFFLFSFAHFFPLFKGWRFDHARERIAEASLRLLMFPMLMGRMRVLVLLLLILLLFTPSPTFTGFNNHADFKNAFSLALSLSH